MAMRSKSGQEEGDALLAVGLPATFPCPKARVSICPVRGTRAGLGQSWAVAPGATARGARKPRIKADASSPAPAAATSQGADSSV